MATRIPISSISGYCFSVPIREEIASIRSGRLPDSPKVLDGEWDIRDVTSLTDNPRTVRIREYINGGPVPSGLWKRRIRNSLIYQGLEATADKVKELDEQRFLSLFASIKSEGFVECAKFNNVNVAVGRRGNLFAVDGGTHRVAIAAALGIDVPVDVVARHQEWENYRNGLSELNSRGRRIPFYQELPHPDLHDLPSRYPPSRMKTIAAAVGEGGGTLLDLGCRYGACCHFFEEIGYSCVGVENESRSVQIADTLRTAMVRRFSLVEASVLDDAVAWDADVILALNIFRYIYDKEEFAQKIKSAKFGKMIFITNNLRIPKKFGSQHKFAEWIADLTGRTLLTIGRDVDGRHIFCLS